MRALGVISTTALFLLLGTSFPASAQDEHHEPEAKPAQHEEPAKPAQQEEKAKPAQHEEQAKPAQQEKHAKPERQPAQAKTEKQPPAKQAKQEASARPAGQQHAQRTAAEVQRQHSVPALRLSAKGNGRIPDDRFRANFGESHVFVINEPVMVGGYSRFQYSGFWFGFVNPWPAEWYYTDNVYVDYVDGGYYLYNPYYPGARVSISVVM